MAAAARAAETAAESAPAIVDDTELVTVAEPLPGDPQTAAALWAQRGAARSALQPYDQWLQQLDWPQDIPMPEAVARVRSHADALRAAIAGIDDREQRLATRIGKLCGRLERALDARKLKPAGGMFADLKRQLALLPEPDAKLQQRVERSRERLDELRDWEYFATAPKREALCVELEALAAATDVSAEARAARVKEARAEWKSFGPLRGEDGKALAKRFDDAAEQAFAPAREHFEAQAEARAENSRQRARICDELQQFLDSYDWDSADWKGVERIYRRARDDWQKFADVDAGGRALGKRYHRLSRDLRSRLEARWKDNIARKEALVASAAALVVDGSVVPGAPGQAKALQQQWKDVDITPRSADRELWKAFRAACDAVFSSLEKARDAEVHDHVALRDTLQIATRALTDALGAARIETRAELDALPTGPVQSAFDALRADPVPRDARKATDAALRAAKDALQQVRDEKRDLEARARLGQLRTALQLDVTLAELDDRAAAETAIAAAELQAPLQAPWRNALQARLKRDKDAGSDRHAACVDLELALGLDSPPEDADLRLARQVARLSSGLRGEANDDPQARILDAIGRLLACPARSDGDRELARRTLAAIEQHLNPGAAQRSGGA